MDGGQQHTVFLDSNGFVWGCGLTSGGRLGLGLKQDLDKKLLTPQRILGLTGIIQVACGSVFTVCLDSDGILWSFGTNIVGTLGLGDLKLRNQPELIESLQDINIVSVHCGANHTLCLDSNSNIYAFGSNFHGQLGIQGQNCCSSPQRIVFEHTCTQIACGSSHTLLLTSEGEVYACGFNNKGQLGRKENFTANSCQLVQPLPTIASVACTFGSSFFLSTEGELYSAGFPNGLYMRVQPEKNIFTVPLDMVTNICTSANQVLCLTQLQELWSFGTKEILPKKILEEIRAVYSSKACFMVIDNDGATKIFGNNNVGQLGLGDTNNRTEPILMNSEFASQLGFSFTKAKSARK